MAQGEAAVTTRSSGSHPPISRKYAIVPPTRLGLYTSRTPYCTVFWKVEQAKPGKIQVVCHRMHPSHALSYTLPARRNRLMV